MHPEIEKPYQKRIQKGESDMNVSYEEKIERYLKGEMTDREATTFEEELQKNDALRKSITEQALAIHAIRNYARQEDERMLKTMQNMSEKDFISQLKQKVTGRSPKKKHLSWTIYTTAAAACISGVIYLHARHNFYNGIKAELEQVQSSIQSSTHDVVRGKQADASDIQKFQKISTYILQKDYTSAITQLESIVKEGDSNYYYQDACWQLSLCYLLNKNEQKAITLLQQIATDKQYHAEKAIKLLKKLQ